jgi:hypothetical protein
MKGTRASKDARRNRVSRFGRVGRRATKSDLSVRARLQRSDFFSKRFPDVSRLATIFLRFRRKLAGNKPVPRLDDHLP